MTDNIPDIIDHLVGIAPGSDGKKLRARRPITKEQAQASWLALFAPTDASEVSLAERFAVATFVATLHQQPEVAAFYAEKLSAQENGDALLEAVKTAASQGAVNGPYGRYPSGPLSAEDADGPVLALGQAEKVVTGSHLSAALEHAHLLVFRPRDASPDALGKLATVGWSAAGIVTLSQLVAFLAFQFRVVAGLKALIAA